MHCMLSVGEAYCCLSFMRVQNVFENLHKRVDVFNTFAALIFLFLHSQLLGMPELASTITPLVL